MSDNLAIIGLPRYTLGSIAGGAAFHAEYPSSNLVDWEPWSIGRLTTKDPRLSYVEAVPTMPLGYYGPTPRVGGVAFPNHSLYLGASSRSFLLDSAGSSYLPQRILPDSDTDIVNTWTGTFANVVDDPYSPDANKQTASGASLPTATIEYTFANPARPLVTGAGCQLMRCKVSWTGSNTPVFTFQLYDGATFITSLSFNFSGWPPLASGDIVLLAWDAADLVTSSGNDVRLRVNASGLGATDTVSVEALDWLAAMNPASGNIIGDTGWIDATMDKFDAAWGDTVSGAVGVAPQQTLAHVFSSNVAGVGKAITLFRDPLNTAGHIDFGEMLVGPKFQPAHNRDWGSLVKMEPTDINNDAGGGANFGVRSEPRRAMSIPMSWLTKAEAHSLFERAWRAGTLQPFVVAVTPNDETERAHTTLYCRFRTLPDITAASRNFRGSSFELVEKM